MEKEKIKANVAMVMSQTTGRDFLKNQIFKNIRQAAERGQNHLFWDFQYCENSLHFIQRELCDLGYTIRIVADKRDNIIDISWAKEDVSKVKADDKNEAVENFKCSTPMVENLKEIIKTDGYKYLIRTAMDLISQAAEEGKNRVKMDMTDVSKETVESVCVWMEKQGVSVSYDEIDSFIEISF